MNILQMDMNLLKVLYLLMVTGSSRKTAERLGISTSAVSHALARLREVLDDPLFRREGHRQVPTLFALSLKDKLAPLFSSLDSEMFGQQPQAPRRFTLVAPPLCTLFCCLCWRKRAPLAMPIFTAKTLNDAPGAKSCLRGASIWCWRWAIINNAPAHCIMKRLGALA